MSLKQIKKKSSGVDFLQMLVQLAADMLAREIRACNILSREVTVQKHLLVHFCNHFIIHAACACTWVSHADSDKLAIAII